MPTSTYVALATTTLSSAASSVTFSSIPASYRDLVLVVQGTLASANTIAAEVNGDTGSNYPWVRMYGTGSSAVDQSGTYVRALIGRLSTSQSVSIAQFMDYSATDKHKTILSRGDAADDLTVANAVRWANTAAITSILVREDGAGSFQAGSTFSLYGIEA